MSLSDDKLQSVKSVLLRAVHKTAKKVKAGRLVWIAEFKEIVEASTKEYPIWLWVDSIQYIDSEDWFPTIEIYFSYYRKVRFKASFYMSRPPGTFEDQTPIPHSIKVEKFSWYDENLEEDVWERF